MHVMRESRETVFFFVFGSKDRGADASRAVPASDFLAWLCALHSSLFHRVCMTTTTLTHGITILQM